MYEKCRCNKNCYCEVWIDYQVALNSLQEAEELAHQNWLEIQHLYDRVSQLESFIRKQGLSLPEKPD